MYVQHPHLWWVGSTLKYLTIRPLGLSSVDSSTQSWSKAKESHKDTKLQTLFMLLLNCFTSSKSAVWEASAGAGSQKPPGSTGQLPQIRDNSYTQWIKGQTGCWAEEVHSLGGLLFSAPTVAGLKHLRVSAVACCCSQKAVVTSALPCFVLSTVS